MRTISKWLMAALCAPVVLVGCTNDEPKQREAFTQFLQTRITDKPGVHVPQPSQKDKDAWGPYVSHYAVITDFHEAMNRDIGVRFQALIGKGRISSAADVVQRRDDLVAARDAVPELTKAIAEKLTTADAEHVALKQPADLKSVFDKAYEQTVTAPAKGFQEALPVMGATYAAGVEIADFLKAHPDQVKVVGSTFQVVDPSIQGQLNQLIEQLNEKSRQISAVQGKLQAVINGR